MTHWKGLVLSSFLFLAVPFVWGEDGIIPPNAEKLQEIREGKCDEAVASWWGFNPEDATNSLQAAFNSGVKKIIIDKQASPWIVCPLYMNSDNQEVFFEEGVELQAKRGAYLDLGDSMLTISQRSNIALHGNGATFRMWKADYHQPPYKPSEWRHAINLGAAKNLLIEDLNLIESGGDGVYVGATPDDFCEDVTIRNIVSDGNNRQGISVISVRNLLVEDSVFKNTGGTNPQAGIDFEPNSPKDVLSNCVIRNCLFENNASEGMCIYIIMMNGTSQPIDVTFDHCVTKNNASNPLALTIPNALKGKITVKDCRFEGDQGCVMVSGKGAHNCPLLLQNVKFVNIACKDDGLQKFRTPIEFFSASGDVDLAGGTTFENVEIIDSVDRRLLSYQDSSREGMAIVEMKGDLKVRREENGPIVERINLQQYMDENYPDLNPRHIPLVKTQKDDFIPYAEVSPNEFPLEGEKAPMIHCRNRGDFRFFAHKGETIRFHLQEFPYGMCAMDPVTPEWITPGGKESKLESFEFLGQKTYEIKAEETGVYQMKVEVNPHNLIFSECNVPFVYWAEPFCMIVDNPGAFYFYVPEETKDFGVKLDSGTAEPYSAAIIDPSGKKVWEDKFLDNSVIYYPEGEFQPGIWTLLIEDTPEKTLDDISFNILGVASYVATQKGAVFVPKTMKK